MSFISELKRRNIARVATAYGVVAWVLAQVAEFTFENFGAPEWVQSIVALAPNIIDRDVGLLFYLAFGQLDKYIAAERTAYGTLRPFTPPLTFISSHKPLKRYQRKSISLQLHMRGHC